jgi:HK97 family phage prohead protease
MSELNLLGPLPRDAVTTLIGGSGLELARLTAAIAISVTTGREVVPGWKPASAEEVSVFCYGGDWVFWKSLVVDICHDTEVAVPMIDFRFPTDPLLARPAEEPDPDLVAYHAPYRLADAAAAEGAGRIATNRLFVVVGLVAAVDYGMDCAMLELYRLFEGVTTLMVGETTAFHEDNQLAADERWAGDFGPVIRLPELRDQEPRVRDFLALGGTSVPRASARSKSSRVAVTSSRAEAFFATEPADSLRSILTDGRSLESRRIKAKARAQGIGARTLWTVAKRLGEALLTMRATDDRPGTLHGYCVVFDVWREVDRQPEGNFLQRFRRGAFAKTIAESRDRMKVNFQHGWSSQFGKAALGPIADLVEDDHGVRYTVPLDDTEDNRRLAAGLAAGLYGSSYRIQVTAEEFNPRPGKSPWNRRGLPERTILEARLPDFGPVASPLYPTTTAGLREPCVEQGQ